LRHIEEAERPGATALDLAVLGLWSLPESITRLTKLTTLGLSFNNLPSLPESITRVTSLTTLNLSRGRLSSLPESITRLTNLKQLFLHDNDALGLPPEVLGPRWEEVRGDKPAADPKAILAFYFKQRRGNRRPLAEAKVLVVGQGSVGKTSLIKYWL